MAAHACERAAGGRGFPVAGDTLVAEGLLLFNVTVTVSPSDKVNGKYTRTPSSRWPMPSVDGVPDNESWGTSIVTTSDVSGAYPGAVATILAEPAVPGVHVARV